MTIYIQYKVKLRKNASTLLEYFNPTLGTTEKTYCEIDHAHAYEHELRNAFRYYPNTITFKFVRKV